MRRNHIGLIEWLRRWSVYGCILLGLAALSWCAWVLLDSIWYQKNLDRELKALIGQNSFSPDSWKSGKPGDVQKFPHESYRRRASRAAAGLLIGRLEIRRLDLSVIVLEGMDAKTLRRGAGHIPGTALPGESGNVGVSAHRDTFFRKLKDISTNDSIHFITPNHSYVYKVSALSIVSPEKVSVLDTSAEPMLTLVTCYPFYYLGNAPQRFVVHARQISNDNP